MIRFTLTVLHDTYAICRLDAETAEPVWVGGDFVSITRTGDELSVICPQINVPAEVLAERDWRCLRVQGPLDFSMVGVIASLATTLAETDVSVFVVSTFTTDYLMVKEAKLDVALKGLRRAGHDIVDPRRPSE